MRTRIAISAMLTLGLLGNAPKPDAAKPTEEKTGTQLVSKLAAPPFLSSDEAIKTLTEGNARYAAGTMQSQRRDQARRCQTFADGQHPIASILSCADSRVPPEVLFDQGIGDLFVIRVAGNVADTDEVGTLEYGVEHLGTPLVVVLGHGKCGAVTAVVEKAEVHGCIAQLVDNIAPAAEKARKQNPQAQGPELLSAAIQQNVWQSIEDMFAKSEILRESAKTRKIKVVGAVYDLHSGTVQWMGQHPQEQSLLKEAKTAGTPAPKPAGAAKSPEPEKPKPVKETPAAHSKAIEPPQPQPRKDNLPALAGLMASAAGLSVVVIRLVGKGRSQN